MEFYNKFQREMEEHDRDFEKRYDEDLNTTLIFVSAYPHSEGGTFRIARDLTLTTASAQSGLFSAVTSEIGRAHV